MKEELFTELLESVHEGGAILRAEMSPSRRSTFEKLDVQNAIELKEKFLAYKM